MFDGYEMPHALCWNEIRPLCGRKCIKENGFVTSEKWYNCLVGCLFAEKNDLLAHKGVCH